MCTEIVTTFAIYIGYFYSMHLESYSIKIKTLGLEFWVLYLLIRQYFQYLFWKILQSSQLGIWSYLIFHIEIFEK